MGGAQPPTTAQHGYSPGERAPGFVTHASLGARACHCSIRAGGGAVQHASQTLSAGAVATAASARGLGWAADL